MRAEEISKHFTEGIKSIGYIGELMKWGSMKESQFCSH
jgi:hypothetical protein